MTGDARGGPGGVDGGAAAGPVGTLTSCPACGAPAAPAARFCEACGHELPAVESESESARESTPGVAATSTAAESTQGAVATAPAAGPAPCRECGGVVDPDGYCETCGAKAPLARDRLVEQPQAWVAGVSDRGVRHHRNEDALALAADAAPGSRAVLVVCDGVSSSEDSDVASLAAARAARDVLAGSRPRGLGTGSALTAVIGAHLGAAADAASDAVARATAPDHGDSPPSCTFVAAVVAGDLVVAGVVGDSRAYWVPDAGEPALLTVDDSWAAEKIAVGVPRAQAESGPQAHAITRWLGVDAPDHTPRVTSATIIAPGWLLLCSDGLWNYSSTADDVAALVRRTAAACADEPLATAAALVDWANAEGGHDNITVALARLGTTTTSGPAEQTNEKDSR